MRQDSSAKVTVEFRIGRSDNKSTMQFSPFEDEVTPGTVKNPQDFSFEAAKISVLIKQSGRI